MSEPSVHSASPGARGTGPGADDLIAEGAAADVSGWDFSWLDGRASEQRPSWGYHRLLAAAWGEVGAALDLDTGGGEVLAGIAHVPPLAAATEAWPPNAELATARLHPRGIVVIRGATDAVPLADAAVDLITSRHPATVHWDEIARLLRPGGRYLAQHVGPDSNRELYEWFLGPQPRDRTGRHPDAENAAGRTAGLVVDDMQQERLRVEFRDVGAVVYFLRKVVWTVPDFSVERYGSALRRLHQRIERDGPFVCHSSRTLVRAHRPS